MVTYHFQCTPKNTAEDIGVPQFVLRPSIVWELDEVRQGVFFEDEGKLLVITCPVCNSRRDVQEDFETNLLVYQLSTLFQRNNPLKTAKSGWDSCQDHILLKLCRRSL